MKSASSPHSRSSCQRDDVSGQSRTTRWRRRKSACAETFWQEVVRRKGEPCLGAQQIAAIALLRPFIWVKCKGSKKPPGYTVSLTQAGRMASRFEMVDVEKLRNPLYKPDEEGENG